MARCWRGRHVSLKGRRGHHPRRMTRSGAPRDVQKYFDPAKISVAMVDVAAAAISATAADAVANRAGENQENMPESPPALPSLPSSSSSSSTATPTEVIPPPPSPDKTPVAVVVASAEALVTGCFKPTATAAAIEARTPPTTPPPAIVAEGKSFPKAKKSIVLSVAPSENEKELECGDGEVGFAEEVSTATVADTETSTTRAASTATGTSTATATPDLHMPSPPTTPKKPSSSRKGRSVVRFNEMVKARLIPSKEDIASAGLVQDLWWSPSEYRAFRQDFLVGGMAAGLIDPPSPQNGGGSREGGGRQKKRRRGGVCMLRMGAEALLRIADFQDKEEEEKRNGRGNATVEGRVVGGVGSDETESDGRRDHEEGVLHDDGEGGGEEVGDGDGDGDDEPEDKNESDKEEVAQPLPASAGEPQGSTAVSTSVNQPTRHQSWFGQQRQQLHAAAATTTGGSQHPAAMMLLLPHSSVERSTSTGARRGGRGAAPHEACGSVFEDIVKLLMSWFVRP